MYFAACEYHDDILMPQQLDPLCRDCQKHNTCLLPIGRKPNKIHHWRTSSVLSPGNQVTRLKNTCYTLVPFSYAWCAGVLLVLFGNSDKSCQYLKTVSSKTGDVLIATFQPSWTQIGYQMKQERSPNDCKNHIATSYTPPNKVTTSASGRR